MILLALLLLPLAFYSPRKRVPRPPKNVDQAFELLETTLDPVAGPYGSAVWSFESQAWEITSGDMIYRCDGGSELRIAHYLFGGDVRDLEPILV